MKLKCILINPWAYDFAAMNLWSRPLGLLRVAEYMSQFDLDLGLIDCTDVFGAGTDSYRERKYGTGKYPRQVVEKPAILRTIPRHFARYGMSLDDFREIFENNLPCELIMVTSVMSYWYPGVQKAIEKRSLNPCPLTPLLFWAVFMQPCITGMRQKTPEQTSYTGVILEVT